LNCPNKIIKGNILKSYIIGLIFKILLLVLFVLGIFFLLQKYNDKILSGNKQNIASIDVKNILISLMDNYEKKLLGIQTGLDEEKTDLLKKLEFLKNRDQKNEIRIKLKEIEDLKKKADEGLSKLQNEKNNYDKILKEKNEAASLLKQEKERMQDEMIIVKTYWENYVNNIKNELLLIKKDKNDADKIVNEFSKDYGKKYISSLIKDYSNKEEELTRLKKGDEKETEKSLKELTEKYKELLADFEEVSIKLAGNDEKVLKKLNESKKDDSKYLKTLKDVSIETIKKKIPVEKDPSGKKDGDNKSSSSGLNTDSGNTTNDLEKEKLELENNIASLQSNIKNLETAVSDKQKEIDIILDQSGINGYFINKNGAPFMIINRKKENEILNIGTFNVYDKNKTVISKIYLSKQGQKIIMTKVPGYNNPVPGTWF